MLLEGDKNWHGVGHNAVQLLMGLIILFFMPMMQMIKADRNCVLRS